MITHCILCGISRDHSKAATCLDDLRLHGRENAWMGEKDQKHTWRTGERIVQFR